jgi:hypothetical protein
MAWKGRLGCGFSASSAHAVENSLLRPRLIKADHVDVTNGREQALEGAWLNSDREKAASSSSWIARERRC